MTDHLDVIAAFADGEPVDAGALKSALADDAGREYLIDLLALRRLVSEAPVSRAAVVEPPRRSAAWRLLPVAALLVAGVSGGFAMGRQSTGSIAPQPAAAPAPLVTAQAVPPELRIPAPAPTRVIKLETGTSWNERSGGN